MKRLRIGSLVLALALTFLAACTPVAAPAPAPATAPAPAAAPLPVAPAPLAMATASTKAAWQVEWDKTLAAARMEGRLSMSGSLAPTARSALAESFKAAYGISVEAISGQGGQLAAKILAERRAGLYLQDVWIGGPTEPLNRLKPSGALAPVPPALILPDVTEPDLVKKTWYEGQLYWLDKDRTVLATELKSTYPIAVNTNLVKEGEIRSWRDLLHPEWQGKVVLYDPTIGGPGVNFLLLAEDRLGWDYFVELVKTRPVILNNERLMIDWLAQGKVAIAVGPKPDLLVDFVRAGAPVRGLFPEEGTWMSGAFNIVLFDKPAHPNAAKILINWLLTREGQTVVCRAGNFVSTRLDVPTDYLPPGTPRDPNMKYVVVLTEEMTLRKPGLNEKAKPLVAPLMGK